VSTTVLVTFTGYSVMTGRMKGATPTQGEPLYVGWGIGGVGTGSPYTAATSDVAPFEEGPSGDYSSRITGTSSQATVTTTDDTYQVVGTVTASTGETIAEMFLSDSATRPQATTVAAGGSTVIGSATNTTMNVTSDSGFPGSGNYDVQVDTEVMTVTGGQGTTTWTVTRGANGSTAISTIAAADKITGGNAPGSTAISGGTIFTKATFTGLALNSGDSIQATFKVTVS
jgi:hypothetical protein